MFLGSLLILSASLAAIGASVWLVVAHHRGENRAIESAVARQAETDARYRAIFEDAPMGCMVWEPGFRIVEWNRQAEHIFGWLRHEIVGRSFVTALLADEARDPFMREATHLLAGSISRGPLAHVTRDGRTVVCQWHHAVLHDDSGAPTQIVSSCVNVTAVTELELENALFRNILDLTDDPAMLLLDAEAGRVLYASESACRHFGRDREALIGTTPYDWDARANAVLLTGYGRALKAKKSIAVETEHRHSSGRLIPVDVTANQIDHQGKAYVAVYIRDLTARRAEAARVKELEIAAALREHEKRYREIFENSSDALFTLDVAGTRLSFDTINPAAETAFGIPAALLKGTQFGKMADGEMGQDFGTVILDRLDVFLACATTGQPMEYEGPLDLLPDPPDARTYHVQLLPLAADHGIERIIGIARDVTLQRRYEAALADSLAFTRELLDAIPNPVFHKDTEGRYRELNAAFERAVGKPREEMLGKTPFDLWPRDLAEHYAATDRQLADNPGTLVYEAQIETPDGRRDALFHKATLTRRDGTVGGQIGVCLDITERKRMERELLASRAELAERERAFRTLAENLPDNVARLDTQGRYIYVNRAHERTLGKSAAELVGTVIPETHVAVRAAIAQAVATGKPVPPLRQPVVVDGIEQLHEVTMVPEFDESGAVVSVLGIGRDMTEIFRLHETVAVREQEFRSLAESSPDHVIRYDRDRRILYLNGSLARRLGLANPEEVVGRKTIEVWPDGRFDAIENAVGVALDTGKTQTVIVSQDTGNGRRRHDQVMVVPERDQSGQIVGALGFGRDITAIRETELALQDNLSFTRELLDAIPDPVFFKDVEGRYQGFNAAFMRFSGKTREEMLGKSVFDLWPPDLAERYFAADGQLIEQPGSQVYETQFETPDGRRDVIFHKATFTRADGRIAGLLGTMIDITERRQLELAVRRSEQEFRSLSEASPDFIARFDLDGRVRYVNDVLLRHLGHADASGLLGRTLSDLWPDGRLDRLDEAMRRAVEAGVASTVEHTERRADGAKLHHHIRVVPEYGVDGKVVGTLGFGRDITDRRLLQDELERREQYQRTLLDNFPFFVWLKDDECRLLAANREYARIAKVADPRDLEGKSDFDFFPRGFAMKYFADDCAVMASGAPRNIEEAYVDENGERRWVETWKAPVLLDGHIVGTVGFARDITDRMRAEVELRHVHDFTERLIEAIPDPIIVKDRDHRWIHVNDAACALFGLRRDQMVGKSDGDLFPAALADDFRKKDEAVFATGQERIDEASIADANGGLRTIQTRKIIARTNRGDVLIATIRDVTPLKEAERRLEQSQRLFQRLSARREKAREDERKRVAHELHEEFGQMLTALRMSISTLPIQYGQQLPALRQRSASMLEIVDQTIRGMRDVVTSLRPPALDAGIATGLEWLTQEFTHHTGLPCALRVPDGATGLSDVAATLAFRIVQEALSNAARHAKASRVDVEFGRDGGTWCAEVRDNGCGFDVQRSRKSLGIFGMEECARMLGGECAVESSPGHGTAVRLRFPAH